MGYPADDTTGGEVAIQIKDKEDNFVWQKLLSSASYSSYNLKAAVRPVTFDEASNTFKVELHIIDKDGNNLVTNNFDVIAVNKVIVDR